MRAVRTSQFGLPFLQEEKLEQLRSGADNPIPAADELFAYGYQLDNKGQSVEAETLYNQTAEFLDLLHDESPTRLSPQELAECAFRHGAALIKIGRHNVALRAFRRVVELLEARIAEGVSSAVTVKLASAVHFLALCEREAGSLDQSLLEYRKALALWRNIAMFSTPQSHREETQRTFHATLIGYSKTLDQLGHTRLAKFYRRRATHIAKRYMESTPLTYVL